MQPNDFNFFTNNLLELLKKMYDAFKPIYGWVGFNWNFSGCYKLFMVKKELRRILWANFFGPEYVEKYGKEFLLNAPGYKKEQLDDGGISYQVTKDFMITDEKDIPPKDEIEGYFLKHPLIKKIKYEYVTTEIWRIPLKGKTPLREKKEPEKPHIIDGIVFKKLSKSINEIVPNAKITHWTQANGKSIERLAEYLIERIVGKHDPLAEIALLRGKLETLFGSPNNVGDKASFVYDIEAVMKEKKIYFSINDRQCEFIDVYWEVSTSTPEERTLVENAFIKLLEKTKPSDFEDECYDHEFQEWRYGVKKGKPWYKMIKDDDED